MSGFALSVSDDFLDELVERVSERLAEVPRWRDVDGLAAYLGTDTRHVRYLRERGLPARTAGKRLIFDLREVDAWIADELPRV